MRWPKEVPAEWPYHSRGIANAANSHDAAGRGPNGLALNRPGRTYIRTAILRYYVLRQSTCARDRHCQHHRQDGAPRPSKDTRFFSEHIGYPMALWKRRLLDLNRQTILILGRSHTRLYETNRVLIANPCRCSTTRVGPLSNVDNEGLSLI